jgi:hypothetical protein
MWGAVQCCAVLVNLGDLTEFLKRENSGNQKQGGCCRGRAVMKKGGFNLPSSLVSEEFTHTFAVYKPKAKERDSKEG